MSDFNYRAVAFDILVERGIIDYEVDYVLVREGEKNQKEYDIFVSQPTESDLYLIHVNYDNSISEFDVPEWDYTIDEYLFERLEKGYEIYYMRPSIHYGVWRNIDWCKNDIVHFDGLQGYLKYCVQHGIDKDFMKQFYQEIDVMDLFVEKNSNYLIMASKDVGDHCFVLGYNKNAVNKYVTWETNHNRQYGYWSGHYFNSKKQALNDFSKRCNESLKEQIKLDINRLSPDRENIGVER